jgi:hypothetical protein
MNTEQASQGISIPTTMVPPVSSTSTVKKTGGVDLKLFRRALFICGVGAMTATGTVDIKLQESVDTTDGNYTDISGGAATQLLAAGGDNRIVTLEVTASQLTAGKRYVRAVITLATAASLLFGIPLGVEAIQKPGSGNNDASVAQRLVV